MTTVKPEDVADRQDTQQQQGGEKRRQPVRRYHPDKKGDQRAEREKDRPQGKSGQKFHFDDKRSRNGEKRDVEQQVQTKQLMHPQHGRQFPAHRERNRNKKPLRDGL